jgi:hypothetical protein
LLVDNSLHKFAIAQTCTRSLTLLDIKTAPA